LDEFKGLVPQTDEYDWTVIDAGEAHEFEVRDLVFIPAPMPGKKRINGMAMRQMSYYISADFGLEDGMKILRNQHELPAELRTGNKCIVLAGALLKGPEGTYIPIICFFEGKWCGAPSGACCVFGINDVLPQHQSMQQMAAV
jgi:hypothetical protein